MPDGFPTFPAGNLAPAIVFSMGWFVRVGGPMVTQDDEHAYVESFARQVFPTWLAAVILIAVVFGLWKLARIVWTAIRN